MKEPLAADDPILSIRNVSKRFGAVSALENVSLDVQAGEIFALLGPSGCGKSTLLRIVAGFESPTSGELLLDGRDLVRLPPNKRPINMVFQSYAVFPHMSVARNVGYGLQMERVNKHEITVRVDEALEQVRLGGLGERMPDQLSGGQRQRVALARALVKRPRLLLLDEPLSALDAKLRDAMRLELVDLQSRTGVTFVIVTHDQGEAMALADRIAVLEGGRLRQIGSPQALYHRPVDAFVADFIGTVHAFGVTRVERIDDALLRVQADGLGDLVLPGSLPPGAFEGGRAAPGFKVVVRPERIGVVLEPPGDAGRVVVTGTLGDIAFQGQHSIAEIRLASGRSISAVIGGDEAAAFAAHPIGQPVYAHWAVEHLALLPERAG